MDIFLLFRGKNLSQFVKNYVIIFQAKIGVFQGVEYSSNEFIKNYGRVDFVRIKIMKKHWYSGSARAVIFRPTSPEKVGL